jgi:hypothetical protein
VPCRPPNDGQDENKEEQDHQGAHTGVIVRTASKPDWCQQETQRGLCCTGTMQVRLMIGIVVLLQLADAATFTIGVSLHGIQLESNDFAKVAYDWAGVPGVLGAKLAEILLILGLLVLAYRRFPRLLVWGAAAASAVGLLGFLSNVASLWLLSRGG